MDPNDIRELCQHLKPTQMEMEFCVRDGRCHVGRIYDTSTAYMVIVIDLEQTVFELVYFKDVISIKIITE